MRFSEAEVGFLSSPNPWGGPEESEIQLKKGQLKPEEHGKRRGFDFAKCSILFLFYSIKIKNHLMFQGNRNIKISKS